MVAFFLCGTPSNHEGFQFVELGPAKLPGSPGSYLDKAAGDALESHRFEYVSVEGQRFVEYSRTLRINPNDSAANRGAYVAAGCLIERRLPMHALANCVDIVSEIFGGVRSALRLDRSFPVGYRLSHYEYRGAPLEDRVAHQSSPLLLADVLMQAVNNEGVFAGAAAKPLTLAPEEVIASDVSRYQLYSADGALQSLRSMERDRSQLLEMTRYATSAAATVNDLHGEWASLQEAVGGAAARVLAKSEALRKLAGDLERAVDDHLSLGPDPHRDRGADTALSMAVARRALPATAGRAIPGRAASPRDLRASAAHGRRRARRNDAVAVPRWAAMLGYGLVGVAIAALLFISVRDMLPAPESVVAESPLSESPQTHPVSEQGLSTSPPHESDVARERAALDALPAE